VSAILETTRVDSPIDPLSVFVRDGYLVAVAFAGSEERTRLEIEKRFGGLELCEVHDPGGARSALEAYFSGDLAALDALAVETGGTPFQRGVWQALRRIPVGSTLAYSELAQRIGSPAAVRAVGAANGRNPVPVVVPCHRVLARDGSLWGFGGGLERKRWLLEHEGAALRTPATEGQRRLFEVG
jgi:methylated-DNA-[protein]-cysteine S-methyltransferase